MVRTWRDACSPEQAYLATKYVDRDIPHIPIVINKEDTIGYTLSTTDWMPYAWSTNNVAHEEVANMALAYLQAGRNNEGFRILKSDLTDEMLLGKSPGNFGQISHYDRERNEAYRDFGDNVGITSRAIINSKELLTIAPPKADDKEKKIGEEKRYAIEKGAGVILKMPLNPKRKLKAIRIKTLSNDIVVGMMAITLQRASAIF